MQTITNCNKIPQGKTYPVEHLRPAESIEQLCQYVDAGHPIAWIDGGAAKCLQRHTPESFNCYRSIGDSWQHQTIREDTLTHYVKLAPLAYKDGRPLHVGDEIEVRILGERWDCMTMSLDLLGELETMQWRFANPLEAV